MGGLGDAGAKLGRSRRVSRGYWLRRAAALGDQQ